MDMKGKMRRIEARLYGKFVSPALAVSCARRGAGGRMVVLGCDGRYWVAKNATGCWLAANGYEELKPSDWAVFG
jgi:hypothetical protein